MVSQSETTNDKPTEHRPNSKMLEMLVCPISKTTLEFDEKKDELVARATRLAYPIRDGIPIMIPSEARPLEDSE